MKLEKASEKWHRKALMIDTRKTMLVIEKGHVKSEHMPPWIHRRKRNQAVWHRTMI